MAHVQVSVDNLPRVFGSLMDIMRILFIYLVHGLSNVFGNLMELHLLLGLHSGECG